MYVSIGFVTTSLVPNSFHILRIALKITINAEELIMLKIQPVLPSSPVIELKKIKKEDELQKQSQDKNKPILQEQDTLALQPIDKAVR